MAFARYQLVQIQRHGRAWCNTQGTMKFIMQLEENFFIYAIPFDYRDIYHKVLRYWLLICPKKELPVVLIQKAARCSLLVLFTRIMVPGCWNTFEMHSEVRRRRFF